MTYANLAFGVFRVFGALCLCLSLVPVAARTQQPPPTSHLIRNRLA